MNVSATEYLASAVTAESLLENGNKPRLGANSCSCCLFLATSPGALRTCPALTVIILTILSSTRQPELLG